MAAAYEFYLSGIEASLAQGNAFIAGKSLSIADLSFVCDFAQFLREGHSSHELEAQGLNLISEEGSIQSPRSDQHLLTLAASPDFFAVLGTYLDWYIRRAERRAV